MELAEAAFIQAVECSQSIRERWLAGEEDQDGLKEAWAEAETYREETWKRWHEAVMEWWETGQKQPYKPA